MDPVHRLLQLCQAVYDAGTSEPGNWASMQQTLVRRAIEIIDELDTAAQASIAEHASDIREGRIRAMLKRCKNRGGDCPCRDGCQVVDLIYEEKRKLEKRQEVLNDLLQAARHKPCTVRSDWTMPPTPAGNYRAAVYNDGGEWLPHWTSKTEEDDYLDFPPGGFSWPFVEDTAYAEDWERLGFEII